MPLRTILLMPLCCLLLGQLQCARLDRAGAGGRDVVLEPQELPALLPFEPRKLDALQVQAHVTLRHRRYPGRLQLRLNLLMERRGRIRLRLRQPGFAELLADILKIGDRILVALPQQQRLFVGDATDLQHSRSILAGIDLELCAQLLAPEAMLLDHLPRARELDWRENRRVQRLRYRCGTQQFEFRVDRRGRAISRVIVRDGRNRKLARADYLYAERDTGASAAEIDVRFYPSAAQLRLELYQTALDPPLREEVFQLPSQSGWLVLPLDQLDLK